MSGDLATLEIRISTPADREALLGFIERSGFNPRDAVTWDSLGMCAMTAWVGDTLVGAIPLEPRSLVVAPGIALPVVHETVVAVHPDHRGRGVGSRLQDAILRNPPGEAVLATVYREDPASGAYRWYQRNGFEPRMHIDSWFLEKAVCSGNPGLTVRALDDPSIDWPGLDELFFRASGGFAGFVNRRKRELNRWLEAHPYRNRYDFRIAVMPAPSGDLAGYALLGIGSMHSETTRVDILDLTTPDNEPRAIQRLLAGITDFAAEENYTPVRWPLSRTDPSVAVARAAGFDSGWSFDLMTRTLRPDALGISLPDPETDDRLRYYGVDYI